MQKRSIGLRVWTLLLVITLPAAYFLWDLQRQANALTVAYESVASRIERIDNTIAAIGTAQQSYVAPGQLDAPWFERTSTLQRELTDDLTALGPLLRSGNARGRLRTLEDSVAALTAADERTRENLSLGQELMAADVIFSDGRNVLDAMSATLGELRWAERAVYAAETAELSRNRWLVLGVTLGGWFVVVVWLVRTASSNALVRMVPAEQPTPKPAPAVAAQEAANHTAETPRPTINLSAVASVCTALSTVTTTAALSEQLSRVASVLDAAGLILWMGAGEQLFAVLGHGYTSDTLVRFGPIARDAANAAARAWRTNGLTVVAGKEGAHGAIVAPIPGPGGCVGVLALEMRDGEEQDAAIQAVVTMIAAQVSTAVSAWPPASVPEPAESAAEVRSA